VKLYPKQHKSLPHHHLQTSQVSALPCHYRLLHLIVTVKKSYKMQETPRMISLDQLKPVRAESQHLQFYPELCSRSPCKTQAQMSRAHRLALQLVTLQSVGMKAEGRSVSRPWLKE
jgi:hypothetical protein